MEVPRGLIVKPAVKNTCVWHLCLIYHAKAYITTTFKKSGNLFPKLTFYAATLRSTSNIQQWGTFIISWRYHKNFRLEKRKILFQISRNHILQSVKFKANFYFKAIWGWEQKLWELYNEATQCLTTIAKSLSGSAYHQNIHQTNLCGINIL